METTLIPFSTLPACASSCGPLYDANGACVPPGAPTAAPSAYASCFCANAKVAPFSAGTAGVCAPGVCANVPGGLDSIRNWFTNFCKDPSTVGANGQPANNGGAGSPANPTSSSKMDPISNQGGGDWISGHWQWVVFLVIMVVGIAGIWVGACVWRRRYLRKKDRQYALGKSLGAPGGGSGSVPNNASSRSVHLPEAGMFMPAPISAAGVYGPETDREKSSKRKWNPTERT